MAIELFFLIAISFLLRFLFLSVEGTDEWMTWHRVKNQTSKWINYDIRDTILQGFQGSPQLQYYIISRFPQKYWGIAGCLLNIIYDLVIVISIYFLGRTYLDNSNLEISSAFIVALVYATTPILFPVNARLVGLKARTFGGLISFLYFISLAQVLIEGHYLWYSVCGVLFVLAVLASAFSMQNIFFVTISICFFYSNFYPFLVILAFFVTSAFLPRVGVKEVILHKFNHYKWYFNNRAGTSAEAKNNLIDLLKTPIYLFTAPKKFIDQVLCQQSYIIALYSAPALAMIIYLLATNDIKILSFSQQSMISYFLYLTISSGIVFVFTSLKKLLFLGEAERYFEYSAPYFSILLFFIWQNLSLAYTGLIYLLLFHLCVIIVNFFCSNYHHYFRALENLSTDKMEQQLIEFLSNNASIKRIITIPTKYSFRSSFHLNAPDKEFYYIFITQNNDGFKYMVEDSFKYLYPISDLDHFQRKYNIDTIVLKKSTIKGDMLELYQNSLKMKEEIFTNNDYSVYRI